MEFKIVLMALDDNKHLTRIVIRSECIIDRRSLIDKTDFVFAICCNFFKIRYALMVGGAVEDSPTYTFSLFCLKQVGLKRVSS